MPTARLLRINELAHKEKEQGLTPEEKAEQAKLRQEYLAAFRKNMIQQLDNVYFVDPDGTQHKMERKK